MKIFKPATQFSTTSTGSAFQRIWEQNKRFLITAGAGLSVFLVLNSFVSAYVARADRTLGRASQLAEQARRLKQDLKGQYWEIKGRLSDYEHYEERLAKDLSLPTESAAMKLEERGLLVQFNEAIESVWGDALPLANERGVELPERLSAEEDFGYQSSDGPEELRRYYDYLGITRHGLVALLQAGMTEIRRPELIPEELQPIPQNGDQAAMMLRPVRFGCVGPYDAYVGLLKSVQDPGRFLQAQVLSLVPVKGSDTGLLKGEILFAGLRLVKAGEGTSRLSLGDGRKKGRKGRGIGSGR